MRRVVTGGARRRGLQWFACVRFLVIMFLFRGPKWNLASGVETVSAGRHVVRLAAHGGMRRVTRATCPPSVRQRQGDSRGRGFRVRGAVSVCDQSTGAPTPTRRGRSTRAM